jgi:hypothetical protein
MPILRNFLAVFIGFAIGSMVHMGLVILGRLAMPPPEGFDPTDMESMKATIHLLEAQHFVFPLLAHALGTLAGSLVAYLLASTHRPQFAFLIGSIFLVFGSIMVALRPAPVWFEALDLLVAYIPMSLLAVFIGRSVARSPRGEAVE